jgi:hypothetical protein
LGREVELEEDGLADSSDNFCSLDALVLGSDASGSLTGSRGGVSFSFVGLAAGLVALIPSINKYYIVSECILMIYR